MKFILKAIERKCLSCKQLFTSRYGEVLCEKCLERNRLLDKILPVK